MRNSPLARTPPPKLASIPDIINEDADPPEEKEETMSPEPPAPSKGVMCVWLTPLILGL